MANFPHSQLLLGPSRTVVITGPHIQIVDSQSGELIASTTRLDGAEKESLLKSGPIRCAVVDDGFTHVATVGDDKKLKVWAIDGLTLLSERELPKKPTDISFTRDGQTIVVSDKFGDIFTYPLHPAATPEPSSAPLVGSSKRGALTSHENPSGGALILGHVSLLTCFLLTPDEKYIITADRDEHIRVSWYPKGYMIERYCLGHEKFVSTIHIPTFAPGTLVSGGGDPMLKVWDWMSGTLLTEVPILETVEPFIKIRAPKGKWRGEDGDEEDGEAVKKPSRRQRRRARKAQTKAGASTAEGTPDVAEAEEKEGDDDAAEGEDDTPIPEGKDTAETGDDAATTTKEEDKLVLVVHKIRSLDLDTHGRFLIFSAVGATALFYCSFPEPGAESAPQVHSLDVGQPIIDFAVDSVNTTWLTLDPASDAEDGSDKPLVAAVSWPSGTPTLLPPNDAPPLAASLQTACAIPASSAELKALDVYSALSAMPKNVDPEHDPLRRDLLAEADSTPEPEAEQARGKGKGAQRKELTQRELARLKKKRALAEKLQEQAQLQTGDAQDADRQRESKRARSDAHDDAADATVHVPDVGDKNAMNVDES
ncbi:hypothetical protein WOLCODRAFT_164948 [Wolfiporia cocos MD-104 SS10]|uniref:Uncharacterized protein n=1 Tax=Wolfiporia cocos (strain MD-104) TaxID=742152 RepID=A0A2H3JRN3_WOLCO|nr:hypothetical protein WOLCODRAFT_164948 [Wolfiporia cocos MD-104 SS10]